MHTVTSWLPFHFWVWVSAFGDLCLLGPCVALVAGYLCLNPASRTIAASWLLMLGGVLFGVAATKLYFLVGGNRCLGEGFSGVSGHSAMAVSVWPTVSSLLASPLRRLLRSSVIGVGFLFAALISLSRVAVHAHTSPEAAAGLLLGGVAAGIFLANGGERWRLPQRNLSLLLVLLLILPWTYGLRFPSTQMLSLLSRHLGLVAYPASSESR